MKTLENICCVSGILFPFVFSIVICTLNIDVCVFKSAGGHNTVVMEKGTFWVNNLLVL